MTRSLVVGTAGHIDHGKSALVLALTGTDPDRLKEEKARGITIELGFAHTRMGDVDVSFVDVPGHERFVRTMLAGAGGFDAVMLVVAADEGVRPQTREHLAICRLLGIERGIVALTKADLVDEDTAEIAKIDVRALVAGTFLDEAPIVAVSAKTGMGLDALRAALATLPAGPLRHGRTGLARLPIDRSFTISGFGTVVTGTLVSGQIAPGDELEIAPDRRRVRVRGVHAHGAPADAAAAPSRVAVNLAGVEIAGAGRGHTLATPGALTVTRRADLKLCTIAPLKHGARVRAHAGTADIGARVAICAVRDDARHTWRPARPGQPATSVPGEGEAFVRLRFGEPVALTRGDRIVLRAYSPAVTIGGGTVLDPDPPSAGLRRPGTLDRFQRLEAIDGAIETWLAETADRGLSRGELVRRAGLSPGEADAAVRTLASSGAVRLVGDHAYSSAVLRAIEDRISALLAAHHLNFPAEGGLSRDALREAVGLSRAPDLFDAMLSALSASGALRIGERIARGDHHPSASSDDARILEAVESAVRSAALAPPDVPGLATAAGTSPDAVARAVHALVKQRRLIRLGDIPFHVDVLQRLKEEVRTLAEVDIATFKARHGLSRKFAIPLLEWLDRERVTRRVGEKRVVLKP